MEKHENGVMEDPKKSQETDSASTRLRDNAERVSQPSLCDDEVSCGLSEIENSLKLINEKIEKMLRILYGQEPSILEMPKLEKRG